MKVSSFLKSRAYAKHFSLFVVVLLTILCFSFAMTSSFTVRADGIGGTRFNTSYSSQQEVYEAANEFNQRLVEEGIVLIKNEDNALPLASGSRINVLGKNSAKIAIGGTGSSTGSGSVEAEQGLTLYQSLEAAGFVLNPNLVEFYQDNALSGPGRPSVAMGSNLTSLSTGETPQESYPEALLATYADYSDAAIVVLTRIGGEGYDLPRTQVDAQGNTVAGSEEGDHYLELDLYEKALFQSLEDDASVDTVIVIVNAVQQMELGFLYDSVNYSKIKAAIVVGGPGQTGVAAIGRILNGQVNPSGRLPSTYAADFTTDPVWYNFGRSGNQGTYVRVDSIDPETGEKTTASTTTRFVDYEEGIYLGYRYWETRGFDENDGWAWYDEHIVHPLGYGLSYTDFTWELVDSDIPATFDVDSEFTFTVKVTNTGAVAGKDVVQLYYTAPYYDGGIEKSYVRLADFAKTPILNPGEFANVVLNVTAKDLASYDYSDENGNGFKGFELEAGDYVFRILKDANARSVNGVNNITVTVPAISGDTAVNGATGVMFTHDEVTGAEIKNLFDDVSQRALNGRLDPIDRDTQAVRDSGGYMNVMTRSTASGGLAGTIPTEHPTMDQRYVSPEFTSSIGVPGNVADRNAADVGKPWYKEEFPTQAENTEGLVTVFLRQLIGLDYDDPLWDDFMNQMTYEEMATLIGDGAFHTIPITRLGKPWSIEVDGPVGLVPRQVNGPLNGEVTNINDYYACVYATQPVVAATFNKELVYEYGVMTGEESIWGNTEFAYSGIYAPGINIHRSPFSGRNFEYYSEDGVLSSIMAAQFSSGAYSKGLYVMMKHYALNDQETDRGSINTWADEQTMREIYFLPYEKAIKDGHAMGAMAAYNNIGKTWTGASYALMTELTRIEWGFEGMIITDWGGYNTNTEWMIRTGVDLLLAGSGPGVLLHEGEALTATQAWALRRASKAIMFTVANSNAMIPRLSYAGADTNPTNFLRGVEYTVDVSGAIANYDIGEELDVTYTAAGLPSQLVLDSETGLITGTLPAASGNWWESAPPTTYTFTVTATVPAGSTINTAVSQTFTIDQASLTAIDSLGSARVGVPYYSDALKVDPSLPIDQTDITFRLDPGQGFPPWWVIRPASGPLPEGLTLNPDGTITGTPTADAGGSYDIIIQVRSPGFADTFIYKTINVLPAIILNDELLPSAEVGTAYVHEILASGLDTIIFTAEGLPAGLSLSEDGTIYGVPETAGSYLFTVTATGEGVLPTTASITLVIDEEEIGEIPTISFDDALIVAGTVGESYNATLSASGAEGITFSGRNLPTGLTLNANGTVSGTPIVAGVYMFSVTASADGAESSTASIVLNIEPEKVEVVVPEINFDDVILLAPGQVNSEYSAALSANGTTGITFSGTNLPAGLTITANGTIHGTPTEAGTFMFKVTAAANGAESAMASVVIVINAEPVEEVVVPEISFDDVILLATGEVDSEYSATLAASGADGITFAATDLPTGLTLSENGTISGTPTEEGTYMFTVTASAEGAESALASVIIVVAAEPVVSNTTGCGSAINIPTIALAFVTFSLAGVFIVLRKRH